MRNQIKSQISNENASVVNMAQRVPSVIQKTLLLSHQQK